MVNQNKQIEKNTSDIVEVKTNIKWIMRLQWINISGLFALAYAILKGAIKF